MGTVKEELAELKIRIGNLEGQFELLLTNHLPGIEKRVGEANDKIDSLNNRVFNGLSRRVYMIIGGLVVVQVVVGTVAAIIIKLI